MFPVLFRGVLGNYTVKGDANVGIVRQGTIFILSLRVYVGHTENIEIFES